MKKEAKELLGAMVNFGSDPYLIETIEEAEEVAESIENATIARVITDDEEFETATAQLDLDGHRPKKIYSFVDGSEFLVCYAEDWD